VELIRREFAASGARRGLAGIFVKQTEHNHAHAVLRLLHLVETPDDIPISRAHGEAGDTLPIAVGTGKGARLRQMRASGQPDSAGRQGHSIVAGNFARSIRVESDRERCAHERVLAAPSVKAVTAMSPLQYQKQLRLQEARRLMLFGDVDVAIAANRVGYESASQFQPRIQPLFFGLRHCATDAGGWKKPRSFDPALAQWCAIYPPFSGIAAQRRKQKTKRGTKDRARDQKSARDGDPS